MSVSAPESPDSPGGRAGAPDSAELGEADLALAEALQMCPRAPWTRIAAAIGVDATTAARRWERLTATGLAWLTAYQTLPALTIGYVDVVCRPGALLGLTERLCGWPCAFSVERTSGPYQLSLGIDAHDLHELDSVVSTGLGGLTGVLSTRVAVCARIYREGSSWLARALTPEQRARLGGPGTAEPQGGRTPGADALVRALAADARRSCAELARDCGMSESAVRRRIGRMVRNRELVFRCDIANGRAGWPVIANYRINAPADRLDEVGRTLSALPETRLCAAVAGDYNLLLCAWLRTPSDCVDFEALISRRCPSIHVLERAITLHMPKRLGRLLDEDGVAVGRLPMMVAP
ncbi:Lrp/AsnC family transcriptional regulator [Saccharopolyspora taberi]